MRDDYQKTKDLGLTNINRWADGIPNHPMSIRLMEFLAKHDFKDYNDHFGWKLGGDGDDGEMMMHEMDTFFEMLDKTGTAK